MQAKADRLWWCFCILSYKRRPVPEITTNCIRLETVQQEIMQLLFVSYLNTTLVPDLSPNIYWNTLEYLISCFTHLHIGYLKLPGLRGIFPRVRPVGKSTSVKDRKTTLISALVRAAVPSLTGPDDFGHEHEAKQGAVESGRDWKLSTLPHSNTALITPTHAHAHLSKLHAKPSAIQGWSSLPWHALFLVLVNNLCTAVCRRVVPIHRTGLSVLAKGVCYYNNNNNNNDNKSQLFRDDFFYFQCLELALHLEENIKMCVLLLQS